MEKRYRTGMILAEFICLSIISSGGAIAYINPGTGAAVVGSIWPMIIAFFSIGAAFIVKHFWRPIKRVFSRKKK